MSQRQLVLIGGESASGKSASLQHLPNQERWGYMNTESGKPLPFRNQFKSANVKDPYDVINTIEAVTGNPDFDGVIVDSLTFLMDMYESMYVVPATDSRAAWGDYAQFFKTLMQQTVAACDKHIIFLAHTHTTQDAQLVDRVAVPVKGSLKTNGIESYFSVVVAAKRQSLESLSDYSSDLLNITEDDRLVGYKHVFQTRITKDTVGERIRGPMGLFNQQQTFMDNDCALLLKHLVEFYS